MKTIDEEELRGYDDTPNKEGLQCIFNVASRRLNSHGKLQSQNQSLREASLTYGRCCIAAAYNEKNTGLQL